MSTSRITIKDVAKAAGVSTATVSRVINKSGFVSEPIKTKVYESIQILNYQPNAVARSLKIDRTHTIGIVIPDITNPYFMTISKAIEDVVYREGYNLFFCSGDETPQKERELLQLLREKRVEAIVLATSGQNEEMIKSIHYSGTPIILIDREIKGLDHFFDTVLEDNVEGAYQLTHHLLQLGHFRIGIINGSLDISTAADRYQGYQQALQEKGIQEDAELIYNGAFTTRGGMEATQYFLNLSIPPSAILSLNNSMTFGVLLELTKRGYKVPEEIMIASYGEIEAAQLLISSGLLSVVQSPYAMGEKVGEVLLTRIQQPEHPPMREIFTPICTPNHAPLEKMV